MPDQILGKSVEFFGAFAFGIGILIWFIKFLIDQNKELKASLTTKDLVIAEKDKTIVKLQDDYLKESAGRVKAAAEGQILTAHSLDKVSDEIKDLRQSIDLLKERLPQKV